MKKSRLLGAECALFLVVLTPTTHAAYVYTYTGNDYTRIDNDSTFVSYDSSMSMNVSFSVDMPLINYSGDATDSLFNFSIDTVQ